MHCHFKRDSSKTLLRAPLLITNWPSRAFQYDFAQSVIINHEYDNHLCWSTWPITSQTTSIISCHTHHLQPHALSPPPISKSLTVTITHKLQCPTALLPQSLSLVDMPSSLPPDLVTSNVCTNLCSPAVSSGKWPAADRGVHWCLSKHRCTYLLLLKFQPQHCGISARQNFLRKWLIVEIIWSNRNIM